VRRLLAIVIALSSATAAAAVLVVTATPSAGAATSGFTVLVSSPDVAQDAPFEGTTPDAAASDATPAEDGAVFDLSDGVDALQGNCLGQLATVDFATGAVTPLPAAPSAEACAGDLAFAPDGTLYGLVQGSDETTGEFAELVRFDTTSGAATVVGPFGPFTNSLGGVFEIPFGGITFDGSGRLFALLGATNDPGFDPNCAVDALVWCLYRVDDPSQPQASTFLGVSSQTTGEFDFVSNLAASCDTVYTAHVTTDGESTTTDVATVNTTNGALSAIGTLATDHLLEGADFDRSNVFWAIVVDFDAGLTFNVATLNPAGGTPTETLGAEITPPDDTLFMQSLAVEPLDCVAPLVVRFTG